MKKRCNAQDSNKYYLFITTRFIPIIFIFTYAYFNKTDYSAILFLVVNTTAAKALTTNNEAYTATFI